MTYYPDNSPRNGDPFFEANAVKLASLIERNFTSFPGAAEVGWGDGLLVFRAGDDTDHLSTPFARVASRDQKLMLEVEFSSPPERCRNSILQIQDQLHRTVAFINGEDFHGRTVKYPIELKEGASSLRLLFPGFANSFLALPKNIKISPVSAD